MRRLRFWIAITAAAAAVTAAAARSHPTVVVGYSMYPTLRPGQLVWTDRTAYLFRAPQAGEVVLFRQSDEFCIKRVYRGPGETVYRLARHGELLSLVRETRARAIKEEFRCALGGGTVQALRVPDDCVWVEGDNYPTAEGSSHFGPVPLRKVLGRVLVRADATKCLALELTPARHRARWQSGQRPAASARQLSAGVTTVTRKRPSGLQRGL